MKKRLILFAIIFLLFMGVCLFSPLFNIRSVEVIDLGERNTNFDESYFDINSNFFLFNSKKYEDKILQTSYVESVIIEKHFFSKLTINIEWKVPVIAVKSGFSYIILDKKGYVLYIQEEEPDFGLIKGAIIKSARLGERIICENNSVFENSVNLYLLMMANQGDGTSVFLQPNIEIQESNIINKIADKYWIDFGTGENIKEKYVKALIIYRELCEKGVNSGIINVSRKNHYVYQTWESR